MNRARGRGFLLLVLVAVFLVLVTGYNPNPLFGTPPTPTSAASSILDISPNPAQRIVETPCPPPEGWEKRGEIPFNGVVIEPISDCCATIKRGGEVVEWIYDMGHYVVEVQGQPGQVEFFLCDQFFWVPPSDE